MNIIRSLKNLSSLFCWIKRANEFEKSGCIALQTETGEEMVGKKVMVLVNLKPAKLAGVLSEGMLLCAEDENGELSLMVPEKKMPAGAEIC